MQTLGTLECAPAPDRLDLFAPPTAHALGHWAGAAQTGVAPIDPDLSDTARFCAAYTVPLQASANCVIVAGKREGQVKIAACLVLATTRADVNGAVRRRMDVRKISFAPMDDAVTWTGMEHGGITPIGLPHDWPILIDARVINEALVVIGSGVRRSKIVLPGALLETYPGAEVIDDLAHPVVTD